MYKILNRAAKGNFIREAWDKFQKIPKGNLLYSRLLGRVVPYSGTLPFVVEELSETLARVSMPDTPKVRNHLNSIHAVALANLGELSTGLVLNYALPPKARCILVSLHVDYVKKARGTLTSTTLFEKPEWGPHQEIVVRGDITDQKNDVVARVSATWLVDAL